MVLKKTSQNQIPLTPPLGVLANSNGAVPQNVPPTVVNSNPTTGGFSVGSGGSVPTGAAPPAGAAPPPSPPNQGVGYPSVVVPPPQQNLNTNNVNLGADGAAAGAYN